MEQYFHSLLCKDLGAQLLRDRASYMQRRGGEGEKLPVSTPSPQVGFAHACLLQPVLSVTGFPGKLPLKLKLGRRKVIGSALVKSEGDTGHRGQWNSAGVSRLLTFLGLRI
jgi:hypothetical protein